MGGPAPMRLNKKYRVRRAAVVCVHASKHTHTQARARAHGVTQLSGTYIHTHTSVARTTRIPYVHAARYSSRPVASVCFKRKGERLMHCWRAYRYRRMQPPPPPPTHYRFRRSTPASRSAPPFDRRRCRAPSLTRRRDPVVGRARTHTHAGARVHGPPSRCRPAPPTVVAW